MQASRDMSCRTDDLSLSDKCSRESRDAAVGFSAIAARAIEGCQHKEANRQPGTQPADLDARSRMLLEKPIVPTIMRLAIPNATVMAVYVLIGLLEVYFVSRLGLDALAGVAPVFPLVSLVASIAQGAIGGGIVTTVARALGTGRIGDASEYAWYAVALSIPLGLATTAAMVVLGPSLYGYMGISGNAVAIAVSYSSTIFAGATLIWMFNFLMAVVRGTGNLRVPVIVVCGGALILVPLSPALIFGAFGYPGLGPSGGAVAMLVYYALGTLAYAAYLWGRLGILKPSFHVPKLSLGPTLAILRIGGMSAIVSASTNLTLAIVTVYVGMSGIEALAGYAAGSRLEFLLVPLCYGIGGPVGIVISANLGAGQIERAIKAAWVGVLMAFTLAELIGLAVAAFPQQWIGIFSQDPLVLQVGAEYLHRVGPFFGFFGLGYVLYCAGQATRRMEASVLAALLRAAIAVLGGYVVVRLEADVTWNFVAVGLGMVAFGLFALPPLIRRSGYE
ncbi:MATE family efflux transporter [Bradyrhizobium sp. 186]|uniref:MATE family efflux transporter n=1 Tax=Bradyrhizobium sp. 186 TaxID=2782654 RepID=UPI0020009F3D|nr:MATE family efflux transporter [Bradyrhizobium sp. 186]UPK37943.1 MATE family efflux transporter [Bradyrhizobium sp. 186]